MASSMEQRPGGPWKGLSTGIAPQNLESGYLLHADDLVIRQSTLLQQRPGLRCYADAGVVMPAGASTAIQSFYPVAINTTKYVDDGVQIQRVVATMKDDATGTHFLAVEEEDEDSIVGLRWTTNKRNFWGYSNLYPNSLTQLTTLGGMRMGDPRIVNHIYTTHKSPGQILNTKETLRHYDFVTGASYGVTVDSRPLGVPAVDYLETSWDRSADLTGIWQNSELYHTYAYRAAMRIREQIGDPTPRAFVKTTLLPAITATSLSGNTLSITTAGPHGLVLGDKVEFHNVAGDTVGVKGVHSAVGITNSTTFGVVLATGPSLGAGTKPILAWRRPIKVDVKVSRPKEQVWSPTALSSTFGITLAESAKVSGDLHSDAWFQNHSTIELYRTKVTSMTPEIGSTDPDDVMLKVGSTRLIAGDAPTDGWVESSNRMQVTFTDTKSDEDLGDFLYTNSDQEGILQGNRMPPMAKVHDEYRGYHFWANTKENGVLFFTVNDLVNSTILLSCVMQSGPTEARKRFNWAIKPNATAADIAKMHFQEPGTALTSNGNDKSRAIFAQAKQIVDIINQNPTIPAKARIVTKFSETMPSIELFGLDTHVDDISIHSAALDTKLQSTNTVETVALSNSDLTYLRQEESGYVPTFAAGSYLSITAPNLSKPNRIYWSKFQIPGACTRINYVDIRDTAEIVGLRTVRDGVYVVTDSGLYLLSGDSGEWTLREHDLDARCWAQGSIQTMGDQLIMLTDQGIQVFGSGQTLSNSVNTLIRPAREQVVRLNMFSDNENEPWITSAIDRFNNEYLLVLPKDKQVNHVLRYNVTTQTWTTIQRNVTCAGFTTKDDINRMLFADQDINQMLVERQDSDAFRFCDEDFKVNFAGIEGENSLVNGNWRYYGYLTTSADLNSVITTKERIVVSHLKNNGDLLYQEPIDIVDYQPINRGGEDMWVITLNKRLPQEDDNTKVNMVRQFYTRIGLVTFSGGDSSITKKFTRVHTSLLGNLRDLNLEIQTDEKRDIVDHKITTVNPLDGFGNNAWNAPWGDETTAAQPTLDTMVPFSYNTGRMLTMSVVNKGFNQRLELQSVSVEYENKSRRSK